MMCQGRRSTWRGQPVEIKMGDKVVRNRRLGIAMKSRLPMACLLLLGACGGDSSTVAPSPSPTPTPVPTPAPTPTPTPTPTPSAYQPAFDFTRDRSFTGLVTANTTQTIPARLIYGMFDPGTIAYTAATRTIAAFGTTIVPGMMGATLAQTSDSLVYTYLIGTSPATLTVYRGSADTTYVGYVRDDEQGKPIGLANFALIGAPTSPVDLPATGTSTYRVTVAQIGTSVAGQALVVDATARSIAGTVTLTLAGGTSAIDVVFRGVVDVQTGRVDGTATTADGAYAGAFHGRFYGPAGTEMGLIFDLADRSGNDLPGVIIGRAG